MTSLLAIDASKYVGHAYFAGPEVKPKCHTWVAQGLWDSDEYGPYFFAFETWLNGMVDVFQPEILAWESPIVVARGSSWGPGRGSDQNNIRRLIGIVSVAELVGMRRNLRCFEVDNMVAKHFMGVGHRRQEGETETAYKDRMIIAVTKLGYRVADSHQADAAAVGIVIYDDLGTPVPRFAT